MKLINCVFTVSILLGSSSLHAYSEYSFWQNQGWTRIADDQGLSSSSGGQLFDTEYLFYKYEVGDTTTFNDDTISIGLQTGFDVADNHIEYYGKDYYGGDLALSFDNNIDLSSTSSNPADNGFEFAIDFGLLTRDKYGRDPNDGSIGNVNIGADGNSGTGKDPAGLYSVTEWNNRISNVQASPFAMDEGNILQSLSFTEDGSATNSVADDNNAFGQIGNSFYRTVTFNANKVLASSAVFTVDAHWTMSCGNDQINGGITQHLDPLDPDDPKPIPEPSILALFSIGILSLSLIGEKRRKMSGNGALIA